MANLTFVKLIGTEASRIGLPNISAVFVHSWHVQIPGRGYIGRGINRNRNIQRCDVPGVQLFATNPVRLGEPHTSKNVINTTSLQPLGGFRATSTTLVGPVNGFYEIKCVDLL